MEATILLRVSANESSSLNCKWLVPVKITISEAPIYHTITYFRVAQHAEFLKVASEEPH